MIKHDDAMRSRLQSVNVREFTPDETVEVLKKSWVPTLERKYNVKIDDAAVRAAIRMAPEYDPFGHRPRAPFKVLQDSAILAHRKSGGQQAALTDKIVGEQVTKSLGLTLNPVDREKFRQQIDTLRKDMNEKVVDQERVNNTLVDLWRDLNQGAGKSHRVVLIAGPTGAGKTFSAQTFAKLALGSDDRMLEIDATKFSGGQSMNTLVGAAPGFESAAESSGLLPDFLAGRGKGTNVIVINEIDKADPELANTLMEMLDTGKLQARDGKTYSLGKSLVIFTTNKGDDQIYPRGRVKPLTREEVQKRLEKIGDREVRSYFTKPSSVDLNDKSKVLPASILNRIDAAVPAAPPSREGAVKIVQQKAAALSKNLYERNRIKTELDPKVAEYLVDKFYVPEDGVRDLNRITEKLVNDSLQAFEDQHHVRENETLNVRLTQADASDHPRIEVSSSVAEHSPVSMAAPLRNKLENPLTNPDARARLAGLEERLEKQVFGQPEAVKTTAKAVRLRAANLQTKTPAITLDLGPTGTGKTELGKALAKELYGDPEAYEAFDMGKIKDDSGLRNLFGSDRGLVGSGTVSPFEQFLQRFPDGGVITFDEIGNMGHGPESKDKLLKTFYSMLDEGRWTSPLGETYDLRKYVIRFTSNEGQEQFQNLPSDDLRMAAWKKAAKKENLTELLKSHGWPEALIARLQGNITLYRPSTEESRKLIAKKMVDQTIRELQEQHGFKSFEIEPDFYRAVSESFFSHSQGARAMKPITSTELTDLFTEALFDGMSDHELKHASFHVSLSDSYSGMHMYKGKTPPERRVSMKLSVETPGQPPKVYSRELADQAAEVKLVSKREALRIALHEAGHAVVNDPQMTGDFVDHATIRGKGGYGGYVRYERLPGAPINTNREQAIAKIGRILAGGIAEETFSPGGRTSGWSSDKQKAAEYAEKAVTTYGLTDHALDLPVQDGKVIVGDPRTQQEIRSLLSEGEKYARQRIKDNQQSMRTTAARLYRKGHLDRAQFEEVVTEPFSGRARSQAPGVDSCIINALSHGLDGHN
jgi:ATP-dependent Clp protease ATP-binding subunit ClpA